MLNPNADVTIAVIDPDSAVGVAQDTIEMLKMVLMTTDYLVQLIERGGYTEAVALLNIMRSGICDKLATSLYDNGCLKTGAPTSATLN